MSGRMVPAPLLVVVYPYKFHEFFYRLLELEHFREYCEVEVWDVSALTTPAFARAVSAPAADRPEVIRLTSWRDLAARARALNERSKKGSVCVIDEVTTTSFREFWCKLVLIRFLQSPTLAVLDLYNGGVPLGRSAQDSAAPVVSRQGFLERMRQTFADASNPREILKQATAILLTRVARKLPLLTTHRLVAGTDWVELARSRPGSGSIKLVPGHSHDYSNELLHHNDPPLPSPGGKIGVLLDSAGPMFATDAALDRRRVYFTSERWYPAVTRLFEKLEAETGTTIEIAGHYKSTHPAVAPYFGNLRVHYGKARQLVRQSEFVITRASTAISYAIIYRKPIIFIYSNELATDVVAMRFGRLLGEVLNRQLVNVDDLGSLDIERQLEIDEERYRAYERACLTSDHSGRPNVQIILEDVMGVSTGAEPFQVRSTFAASVAPSDTAL